MLTAHHLRLTLEVETPLELDEHPGASLRGMLFNALRGPTRNPALGFCTQRHLATCADCALVAVCPVASLVATLNPQAERGRDVPRPYAIVPPLAAKTRFEPGETLTFGLTLFGQALALFPYVVMGLRQAGPGGLGQRLPAPNRPGRYQRGRFTLRAAHAVHLLDGEAQTILRPDSPMVQQPALPVTAPHIAEASVRLLRPELAHAGNGHGPLVTYQSGLAPDPLALTLTFQTPTRLIHHQTLQKQPLFSPLFQRLLERLTALSREFAPLPAGSPTPAQPPKNTLLALADQVELVDDQTRWQELWSYSARQGKRTPIGGLLGQATYRAPRTIWEQLLPYLLWGTITHVGKNAVKGDGLIAVSR